MLDTERLHIQELVKIEKVACETKLTVIMVDYTLWNRCRERVNKDRELPSTCTEVGTFDANSRDMGISTGQSNLDAGAGSTAAHRNAAPAPDRRSSTPRSCSRRHKRLFSEVKH